MKSKYRQSGQDFHKSLSVLTCIPFRESWRLSLLKQDSRRAASSFVVALLVISLLASALLPSAHVGADASTQVYSDALVLVNSASSSFSDFAHFIKPYLDYFGIPYSTLDIKTTEVPSDLGKHSVIVVGHKDLDPPHTYLSSMEEGYITDAVNAGSGLVNFDSTLTSTSATVEFLCSDDAHQNPVYSTFDDPSEVKPYDNDWDEFQWSGRPWPGMFAYTTENPRVITFYADVPNDEYQAVACLYNSNVGNWFTYYYSFSNQENPIDKSISFTATVEDHAEYSLGTVTVDDGRFELYTNRGESSNEDYGWFYIKLTTALYDFVQQIFDFDYTQPVSADLIQLTGAGHYITSSQPIGNTIYLYDSITATGIITQSPATTLLELVSEGETHPLLIATSYGQGRAVQWSTYEFLDWSKLGYFIGLDDVFWRSFVWVARKPFVMQGMLPFVTLRVDDCSGPFNWIQEAYDSSFIPIAATFITDEIENPSELAAYVQQGKAIACVHERTAGGSIWWENIDTVEKAALYWELSDAFHVGNGIPYAKTLVAHFCEIGIGLMPGMHERGIEFIASEIDIGMQWGQQFSYFAGPYMTYQHPESGRCHYLIADWAGDDSFFNLYVNPYGWFSEGSPDWLQEFMSPPNVQGAINDGIKKFKRSLDSMAVGIYLTHEPQIETIGYENFGAVMAGIHDGIASYNPIYTDYDTMSQYVRAVTTSNISSAVYDPSTKVISVTLTGNADIATKSYFFAEENGQIKSKLIDVPSFTDTVTVAYTHACTIESCDAIGTEKNTYDDLTDTVYVNGSGYWPFETYDVYVVQHGTLVDDHAFPEPITQKSSLEANVEGKITATTVWDPPLTPGKYDIVVDANHDSKYNAGTDAVDNNEISINAGFFVVHGHPPTIQVTSPNGGELWKPDMNHLITWQASDADGDQLFYDVAYSSDGGQNWIPLATDITETSYTWDISDLSPGNSYLIKVGVTDGFNTMDDVSDGSFTIAISDVALSNLAPFSTLAFQGYARNISVTAKNEGSLNEAFTVVVHCNSTSIGTQTITLAPNAYTILTFTWDTTGFTKGNYTISAYATSVPGETDTADNTLTYGIVELVTPGDVNADGIVNVLDAAGISAHWHPGPPIGPLDYDPNFDIDSDGAINVVDASIVSAHWTGPPKGPLAP